ncbi:methyltransferase [Zhongshania aliphaticivorans]|uniref:methyltransferase n=1 Tax=Zhongshania aliphaticivorans TaxID=1470434 RepID=UPI0012E40AAF|nr:methyltransferase [Zhongshania aliphaticivorans]CAA0115741.1 Uncharacterised protein [Zhongshania aliphaticivorans]
MNFSHSALQLNALLKQHQALWRYNAYNNITARSFDDYPELLTFLFGLTDDKLNHLQSNDRDLLTALAPYFPPATELLHLISLTPSPEHHACEPPAGIPGRKWQQIQAFINAHPLSEFSDQQEEPTRPARINNTPLIEWCSGKGYLSEALTMRYGLDATGLEIDEALVSEGNQRAENTKLKRKVVICDVLSDKVFAYLNPSMQVLALHACGALHQRLLTTAVASNSRRLSFSPCCYHRFNDGKYHNLSPQMQNSGLRFSNDDLRTAVRQTHTARAGETAARRQLQARYLALRVILDKQGISANTPLPSTAQHWSKASFGDWLATVLKLKPLSINIPSHLADYEKVGWQLLKTAERIDLVRMAFRRAIELHCVLDSVLFLQEHQYHCTLSEFCSTSLTPRNLLIQAEKA